MKISPRAVICEMQPVIIEQSSNENLSDDNVNIFNQVHINAELTSEQNSTLLSLLKKTLYKYYIYNNRID